MRSVRSGLLIFLFSGAALWVLLPAFAQQATSAQAASDPQAVAVVQAAITALGGASAIAQAQSWTFQAQMQGPHANGNVDYVISTDVDTGQVMRSDGSMNRARLIHSHFVPALVGTILLKESQDAEFYMKFLGASTVDSKTATSVAILLRRSGVPAQVWTFDAANLPIQIDFRLPAEIGARRSVYGLVGLSNYQPVSGVLYPFQIISFLPGKPPEMVTIQSVNPNTTVPTNEFNGPGGDL